MNKRAPIKRSQTTKEVMPKPLHSILVNKHEVSPHIDSNGNEVGVKHDYDTLHFHANRIKQIDKPFGHHGGNHIKEIEELSPSEEESPALHREIYLNR